MTDTELLFKKCFSSSNFLHWNVNTFFIGRHFTLGFAGSWGEEGGFIFC